jgi:hypothetical protein
MAVFRFHICAVLAFMGKPPKGGIVIWYHRFGRYTTGGIYAKNQPFISY